MKRVELTAEAELDAFEIAHYYEQERAGLGYRFEGDHAHHRRRPDREQSISTNGPEDQLIQDAC